MTLTIPKALRFLLGLAAALIVLWSFVFVGNQSLVRRQAERARPITLTILHWGDQAEDKIVSDLVDHYTQQHGNVQIVRINAGSDFDSKLRTMMAANTPPDLFYLPPGTLADLAQLKLIRPIDDYIKKDLDRGDRGWYDDFFPVLLSAFRYETETETTGKGPLYGLPKDFSTTAFYVNADLFDKAGVPVPYGGWTWDQYESACRKITALNNRPEFRGRNIYGGYLGLWPDTLRQILWSYGADFFGPGGFRDVALESPPAQEALQMIARTRLEEKTVFNPTGIAKDGGQEFFTGNIGCIGPLGRWMTPRYKSITNFRWDVVPCPVKANEPQYKAGQIFLTAWTMSSQTKHPDEAYSLMRFLCGGEGARQQSRLGLAIPPLQSVANSEDFLNPPGIPKIHSGIFLDEIKYSRIQQTPREPEWNRIVGDHLNPAIQTGEETTLEAARTVKAKWLEELDSPLRRQAWQPLRWGNIIAISAAVVLALLVTLYIKARREKLGPIDRAQERSGWLFISPWIIGFVALMIGPMVLSLLLSFTKWSAMSPLNDALSVGGANYKQLMTADDTFFKSLLVTFYFVVLSVPISQAAALAIALLMNVRVKGIELFRTIYFVPSVVGGVAVSVLWLQIFNKDYGILNRLLQPVARLFHTTPPDWFGNDAGRWAIPAFVIMGLWGVGGGMILYLAGLKGIPASLYEAATIDGAGKFRKFWNVTLPMLSPLIFFNLVMGIIGSFQFFTQPKVMTDGGPSNKTLVYALSLYRQAFEFHNMGYASAMAWILFVLVLLLTILVFRGSRNVVYYEGLKS